MANPLFEPFVLRTDYELSQYSGQTHVDPDWGDAHIGIEKVIGSKLGDTFNGAFFAEILDGHDGNDTMFGNGGDDTLMGGDGFLEGGSLV
ncbi:MAG: hypothetical protein AAFY56_04900 [Pseudomonadota bacterium]